MATSSDTVPTSTFASLAVRNYRLYFIGQTISGAGSWMQNVAVGWLVLQTFHSGSILGFVTAARYGPLVLLGLWGGLIVDRLNTRALLLATQTLTASLSLVLALLALDGHIRLPVLLAVVAAIGLVDIFDVPSRQSIVSELVPRERVGNAIALTAIATNTARSIGPALAGGVIAALGVAHCFFLNAASFGAFIVALLAMRSSEIVAARETRAAGQVRAGLRYVLHTPPLLAGLVMVTVTGTLTWEFPVILPLLTTLTFHGNAAAFGFAMSMLGIGSVLGGLVAARRRAVTVRSLAASAVVWGMVIFAAAAAPTLIAFYVLLLGVGIFGITFNSAARTLLQVESVPAMRGRVMSLWFMGWQGSTVIGAPIVGTVAAVFGPRYGLLIGGAAAVLVGATYLRFSPATVVAVPPADVRIELAED